MNNNIVLVFDLDDTLYPEHDYVLSGLAAVDNWLIAGFGIQGFKNTAYRVYKSGIRDHIFNEVLLRLDVDIIPFMLKAMVDVYRAHLPRIELYPDAKDILKYYNKTVRLCLITGGDVKMQRNKVAALQIIDSFVTIVYTDELGREGWIPSDEAFRRIMRDMDCVGSMCVFVADNPSVDFIAPNVLGWQTVHIQRDGGEYSKIDCASLPPAYRAQTTIKSLIELKTLFAG